MHRVRIHLLIRSRTPRLYLYVCMQEGHNKTKKNYTNDRAYWTISLVFFSSTSSLVDFFQNANELNVSTMS